MNRSAVTRILALAALLALVAPGLAAAHEPPFTSDFDRQGCTFVAFGNNPWFPLWPGYSLLLEGEEEDDGEILEVAVHISVLTETEIVDGVLTRVLEEREWEDEEITEVSRNFVATCRETGDLWYFGEDVDNYEDGQVVDHDGSWRAGMDGATPGILMPGNPLIGARYQQEMAPGVAEDRGEIVDRGFAATVPYGSFENVLWVEDTDALDPGPGDPKYFAYGVGQIKDEALELTEVEEPPCMPDATTLCLTDGRFRVEVEWESDEASGAGNANQISDDSGELWFFNPGNVELLVKVLDGCQENGHFWVFAGGLTNVQVDITVTDTQSEETWTYQNPQGHDFSPVLDTSAFGCR